jgi:hypothetical protein
MGLPAAAPAREAAQKADLRARRVALGQRSEKSRLTAPDLERGPPPGPLVRSEQHSSPTLFMMENQTLEDQALDLLHHSHPG